MRRHLSLLSSARPTGELVAQHIPALGGELPARLAPAWAPMPRGLSRRRQAHTLALELGLRLRLARVGLWRGLMLGQGVLGASRLYATHIRHVDACKDTWRAEVAAARALGQPAPARPYCECPREELGLVSTRLITDAGVAFLVDDWDNNAQDLTTMNFHGCGTGAVAEAVADTALGAESTTILNPDSTRATGTRSQPAANQYRSVGTLTFDGAGAITEHGLFSASATGTGTLWDRSTFGAITVASGDSIQFTYTCTVSSGG